MKNILASLREELLATARQCYNGRLQTGNGGNLSARVPGTELMLVKASEVSFSSCSETDFVLADCDGNMQESGKKPSSECLLHGAIYRALPECGSIVHCHSPWATGWASTSRNLPHATYHSAIKMGEEVRVFDTGSYVVPAAFFPQITGWLASQELAKAFLLRGHGQVAMGGSIAEALYTAELVEETAHIACIGEMLAAR